MTPREPADPPRTTAGPITRGLVPAHPPFHPSSNAAEPGRRLS